MKRVEVKWRDITSRDGWNKKSLVDNLMADEKGSVVNMVGYQVDEDEDYLLLVDSYFEDKKLYGTIHKIPRGCIISITALKPE